MDAAAAAAFLEDCMPRMPECIAGTGAGTGAGAQYSVIGGGEVQTMEGQWSREELVQMQV